MKYIDIFLASSIDDMKYDRIELGNYIRSLNDRFIERDIYIRLHMCEDISDDIAQTRKQDEYNDIIKKCDYFYIMAWHKLGGYTREEFDVAVDTFRQKALPKISTFFKESDTGVDESVIEFMEELDRGLNHYYTRFASIDSIKLKILLQITDSYDLRSKLEFKDSRLLIDGDHMKSIRLEDLPFYSNHKEIAEFQRTLADLNDKISEARRICMLSESEEDWDSLGELQMKRKKITFDLHAKEMALLDTTAQLTRLESSGELVTHRTKKAISLFESGYLEEAIAVLNEKEFEEDLERIIEKEESIHTSLESALNELLCKIKLLKNRRMTEDNAAEIIRCYERARELIRKYRLDNKCIIDFMWFLRDQKQYTYAAEIGEKLYYDFKSMDMPDPPVWAKFCCDLGILYRDIDRMKQAEELLLEASEIRRGLARSDPERYLSDLAYSCNSLGILYRLTDRIDEAARAYTESLSIWNDLSEKDLVKYGGDKANTCNNFAYMYLRTAEYDKSEKLFFEAFRIRSELARLDPDEHNIYLGRIYNNIGELYRLMGRFAESEKYLLEGLRLRQESIKVNPVYRTFAAGSSSSLGVFYAQIGEDEKAEKHLTDAIRVYRHRVEENFESYASYLADNCGDLGNIYRKTGRIEEARALLDEALDIYRKIAEKNPAQYRSGLGRICIYRGVLYSLCGDEETALELFEEAYGIFEKLSKKIPLSYSGPAACASYNTALSLFLLGKYEDAEKKFADTLSLARAIEGESAECAHILSLIENGKNEHIIPFPSHVFTK